MENKNAIIVSKGTGMTLKNSTTEERVEIHSLLIDKGFKVRNKTEDLELNKYGFGYEKQRGFIALLDEDIINPKNYLEMKNLIEIK